MTILVTGFEPFGNQPVNASWEVASRLPSEINGVKVKVRQLPVAYYDSIAVIEKTLKQDPSITDVILLGEAGGRNRISIEMLGVNYDSTPQPDNAGVVREGVRISERGDDAYFATLPVKEAVEHLVEDCQVPAYASWSAGHFVCNHTLYGTLQLIRDGALIRKREEGSLVREKNDSPRAGFVHLPYTSGQGAHSGTSGLPVSEMVRSIEYLIEYLIDHPGEGPNY